MTKQITTFNKYVIQMFFNSDLSFNFCLFLGLSSLSTHFQVTSGRCLLLTEGMITTLQCCLTEISHRRHSCMKSRPDTLFWINQFLRRTNFICRALDKEASTIPIWLVSAGNRTRASQTQGERSNHSSTEMVQ